jgi:hypothetical protein
LTGEIRTLKTKTTGMGWAQIREIRRKNHHIGLHGDEQEKKDDQPHCTVWGVKGREKWRPPRCIRKTGK